MWTHIQNFGIIIKSLVRDYDDSVLNLGLELSDITERITAVEFQPYEIENLEDKIISYLDQRKIVYEEFSNLLGTPKPKHHYLTHYGQSIRLLGPPLSYWTGRFDAKH